MSPQSAPIRGPRLGWKTEDRNLHWANFNPMNKGTDDFALCGLLGTVLRPVYEKVFRPKAFLPPGLIDHFSATATRQHGRTERPFRVYRSKRGKGRVPIAVIRPPGCSVVNRVRDAKGRESRPSGLVPKPPLYETYETPFIQGPPLRSSGRLRPLLALNRSTGSPGVHQVRAF
jgi:hypothetical protein